MKLLLAEDDTDLAGMLAFSLGRAGFQVVCAQDLPVAVRLFREQRPDVAVLDAALGEWSGFDLLQIIRSRSGIPVLMLTGRTAEEDKICALDLGADDYITKPFSHRELVARIQAQLRRQGRQPDDPDGGDPTTSMARNPAGRQSPARGTPDAAAKTSVLRAGPLTLDTSQHTVHKIRKASQTQRDSVPSPEAVYGAHRNRATGRGDSAARVGRQ